MSTMERQLCINSHNFDVLPWILTEMHARFMRKKIQRSLALITEKFCSKQGYLFFAQLLRSQFTCDL